MSWPRNAVKAMIYAPLAPLSIATLCRFCRFMRWLPEEARSVGDVRKILVVQPHNSLGDLVLSVPFLAEVHRLWPGAEIDIIVGSAMRELFENIPFVNRVIAYTPSKWRQPFRRYRDTYELAVLAHGQLRSPYHLALDPRWDSDVYAYLARATCLFSGAAQRVAYSGLSDGRDPSLDLLLTRAARGGTHEHELIRKLKLFERTALSSRRVQDQEQLQVSEVLRELAKKGWDRALHTLQAAGIETGERYGVIAPSASAANRIWPTELLGDVVRGLSEKAGLRFVAVGSMEERGKCEGLAHLHPGVVTSLAGQTSILELFAVLGNASIFVGNDSGPAHISGMLGRNTVVVSPYPAELNGIDHVNSPCRFGPCGPRVRVAQAERALAPCRDFCGSKEAHCVGQVPAEQVLAYCFELLAGCSRC